MFNSIFGGAKKVAAQITNKNLLEAVGAAALYVASGDGIDSKEFDQLRVSVSTNSALSAFSEAQVNSILSGFRQQLENSPRMAKMAMRKECEDITDPGQAETVFAIACDVADQGGIDDVEKARLLEVAGWLRVDAKAFGL